MKAIVVTEFGKPEVMKYIDREIPTVSPTQVLIKVERTSINFADVKSRYGNKGGGKFPFVPGLDAAGVIVEVISAVQHLNSAQRVIAFPANGSYSEYVIAEETLTYEIPDSIDFDTAAACPTVSFLSYKLLADIARIEPGESILIHSAAGGVGATAIQLANLLGAGKVIGTVSNENKASAALISISTSLRQLRNTEVRFIVNPFINTDTRNGVKGLGKHKKFTFSVGLGSCGAYPKF